jgi:hypothetical protein
MEYVPFVKMSDFEQALIIIGSVTAFIGVIALFSGMVSWGHAGEDTSKAKRSLWAAALGGVLLVAGAAGVITHTTAGERELSENVDIMAHNVSVKYQVDKENVTSVYKKYDPTAVRTMLIGHDGSAAEVKVKFYPTGEPFIILGDSDEVTQEFVNSIQR